MMMGIPGQMWAWIRHNIEFALLILPAIAIAAIWALAELTDEVIEGSTLGIDRFILLSLRAPGNLSDPIGPWWMEEMGRDLTALGGVAFLTLATLSVAGFFMLRRRWAAALYILAAIGGGILLSTIAKELVDRPRPDLVPHNSLVGSASFPSGHSMMAAIVYLTLGSIIAWVQASRSMKLYVMALSITFTILVGCSRIYLGVHWPTDVAAGWLAGGAWAVICLIVARRFITKDHL